MLKGQNSCSKINLNWIQSQGQINPLCVILCQVSRLFATMQHWRIVHLVHNRGRYWSLWAVEHHPLSFNPPSINGSRKEEWLQTLMRQEMMTQRRVLNKQLANGPSSEAVHLCVYRTKKAKRTCGTQRTCRSHISPSQSAVSVVRQCAFILALEARGWDLFTTLTFKWL